MLKNGNYIEWCQVLSFLKLKKIYNYLYFFKMQKTTMSHLNVDCVSVICSFLDINTNEHVLDAFSLQGKELERVLNYWKRHSHYTVEENKDCKVWYRNGILHRDGDLPAIIWEDRGNEWWKNGKRHREGDLPAIEWASGTKEWWKNGKLHREGDLPVFVLGKKR
jgi:hypothetical protein